MAKADGSIIIEVDLDQNKFEKKASSLASLAKKALAGLGVAVGSFSAYAIKAGSDFEAGMSKVAAISGATGKDLDKLKEKAMEMGAKTKFSASESAEALNYMAMAGWKTEDMLDGLEGIMNLAAASGEDLATTSDIVTDALTAFGLSAKDSTRFADILASASSNANTNVSLMGETFKYVAPVAGALGYSVEDTAVAIGLMANAGIKGSQAGTALRSMLTRLAKPTDDVAQAMDTLGISLTNNDGSMKSFSEITKDLRTSFSKLSEAQKAELAATLAGQEGMSGLLAIVNSSDTDFNKLTKAINNSSGSAKKMADTMNNNLKGKLTIIGSTLEGIGIKAYDKFEKPLSKALDSAQTSLNKLDKSMSSGKLGKSVDKLAEGFGDLVEVTINLATDVLPMAIDAFALLADNSDLVIGAIAGVSGALLVYNNYQKISNALNTASAVASLTYGTAQSVLAGNLTAAAGAQEMLNLAMNANPAVLLTTAVVGLTTAAVALSIAHGEEKTAVQELNEELTAEAESFKEVQKAAEETAKTNVSEIDNLSAMKKELDNLIDANGKVKEGFESRASYLVNELAEATGIDIKLVDGQIQNYSKLSDEIQKTIDKMRAEAILEAHKEEYQTAVEKQADAQKKLNQAKEAYNKVLKNSQKYIEDYMKSSYDHSLSEEQNLANARKAYENYKNSVKDTLDKAQSNYNNYTEAIVSYEQTKTDIIQEEYSKVNDTLDENSSIYAKTVEEKKNAYSQEISDLQNHIATLWSMRNDANAETIDAQIKADLDSITEKKKALDQIIGTVNDANPVYVSALTEMVNAGQKAFDDNGNLTEDAQKKLTEVFTKQNELAPEYSKILTDMANKGKDVFNSNGELTTAAQNKLIAAYAKAYDLSPTYSKILKDMAKNGQQVFNENGDLSEEAKNKVLKAAKKAGDTKTTFGNSLKSVGQKGKTDFENVDYTSAGKNAASGIAKGASSGSDTVWGSFKRLASNALSAFKKTLGIHSPSREFIKATYFALEGINKSARDNENLAVKPFEEIADDILSTFDEVKFDNVLKSIDSSKIEKMASKINNAIKLEQMKMTGAVSVKGQYEIDKAVAELKQSDKPLKGILQGNITVITNIDGREAAITLAPLVSEEIEFNT